MIRRLENWMWADACALLDKAARLEHVAFALASSQPEAVWEPPADVLDEAGGTRIEVALPGVSEEQLSIRLDETGLLIEAYRPAPLLERTVSIRRLEIPYGRYRKRLALRPARYRLVERQLRNGCLSVWLERE